MQIKPGVNIQGIKLEMRTALVHAEIIWREHGQELVVTSGLEGEHRAGSLHYYGYALDFRSKYFSKEDKIKVAQIYQKILGTDYMVLNEPTHIHVEYRRILECRR